MLPYSHAVVKPFFLLTPSTGQAYRSGGMAAVLEIELNAISTATKRIPPQLAPYLFKKGQPAPPGAGRRKGSRDAATIYLESLPLKARQWVKSTAPATLIDARKIALPIESDVAGSGDSGPILAFLAQHMLTTTPSGLAPPPLPQNPQNVVTHVAATP